MRAARLYIRVNSDRPTAALIVRPELNGYTASLSGRRRETSNELLLPLPLLLPLLRRTVFLAPA